MCFFRKKKESIPRHQKNEAPPDPPLNKDALAVVFNEDKTKFCEVFKHEKAEAYVYDGWQIFYDDYEGYYWEPLWNAGNSFFDTPEKAKQAAEDCLKGK